jgi:hypothetical protein
LAIRSATSCMKSYAVTTDPRVKMTNGQKSEPHR